MHHPFPFEVFEITHAAIIYDLLHQRTLQLSVASLHPFVNQKLAQNFRENVHHKVMNASYLSHRADLFADWREASSSVEGNVRVHVLVCAPLSSFDASKTPANQGGLFLMPWVCTEEGM